MRILAVSVAPLFPGAVHGGSQRILMAVAQALGAAGHDVRVLCSRRPENDGGFKPHPRVVVEPSLLLRGTFPSPYEVAPHRLARTAAALADASGWADRAYLHADAVFMRHALGGTPVIRSFHDFLYEEALLSAFALPSALTIVPSEYLKRCIEVSVSGLGVREMETVMVVPNGVHVPARLPTPKPLPGIGPKRPGETVLLYPHRPDARKGIAECLKVLAELKRRRPKDRVRLLVASHVDEKVSDEAATYRGSVTKMALHSGVEDAVEFFGWLAPEQMPSLYAFADATLCIGSFIEAFGLVPLESAAAGTPAVCARVGALRDLEGTPGLSFVPYGDVPAATDAVEGALEARMDSRSVRKHIASRFSLTAMQDRYVEAITGRLATALKQRSGPARPDKRAGDKAYRLAPWCHIEGRRIYNDYEYGYCEFPALLSLITGSAGSTRAFTQAQAESSSTAMRELETSLLRGYVVPVPNVLSLRGRDN
ncbi:MAG: glycosyltransferase [Dehalococcoidia bacterium]|nr:glycosyltransferase [Dehalococcoidia bacterium]